MGWGGGGELLPRLPQCPVCKVSEVDHSSFLNADLMEGQNCSAGMGSVDKFIYRTNLLDGIRARDMVQQGSMSETVVPCRAGLVCRRVTLTRSVCMAESGENRDSMG